MTDHRRERGVGGGGKKGAKVVFCCLDCQPHKNKVALKPGASSCGGAAEMSVRVTEM